MPMFSWTERLISSRPRPGIGHAGRSLERGLRLAAAALVVDGALDQRLGEDPREDEREQTADGTGEQPAEDEALLHGGVPYRISGRGNR